MARLLANARIKAGATKNMRRDGYVPGIVYAKNHPNIMIRILEKDLVRNVTGLSFFSKMHVLQIDEQEKNVLTKAIQWHPVTDRPIHIDFQAVDENSEVKVSIPVHFQNEDKCPGIKLGGVLNIVVHTLEIVCLAKDIPEDIKIDLTGIEAGTSITLASTNLGDAKAAHPERDNVLATIVAPKSDDESSAAAQ